MSNQAWTYHGGGVCSKLRKDGRRVYFIKYRRNGTPVFERVGLDEQKARDRRTAQKDNAEDPKWIPPPVKRKEAREALKAEQAAKAAEKPAHTFTDLLKVYRDECMKAKRRADWQEWMLKLVEEEFGALPLADLNAERIEAWRDKLTTDKKSPSTVRKYVYFVSGIYADSVKTTAGRKLVQDNPCRLVALPAEPKGLRKALTRDQAAGILTAARNDAAIYRWAGLVLRTGMRVEEAQKLEWGHTELEWDGDEVKRARFAVHETKTGRPRYVEAGKQLLPDLAAWYKADCAKVNGTEAPAGEPSGSIIGETFEAFPYSRWRPVFTAAKVPWGTARGEYTTRNLRTTFCMLAFQNGARPEELVQQTGHSLETLFAYYAEASRDQRRRAVDSLPDLKRAAFRVVG
jgi:integrase